MRRAFFALLVTFLTLSARGQLVRFPMLPNASAAAQPDSFVLLADPTATEWTTDVVASSETATTVNTTNCCFPGVVPIPANGVRLFVDMGRSVSIASSFTLLDLGPTAADAYVIARHKAGMRLTLPALTAPLTSYGQAQTALGLVNSYASSEVDATRVWFYQSGGSKAGVLTFAVLDENGHEVDREFWPTVRDRLATFRLAHALPVGGSVVVTSGCVSVGFSFPGCNSPDSAPDGQTFVFFTVGPETGKSAPLAIVPH